MSLIETPSLCSTWEKSTRDRSIESWLRLSDSFSHDSCQGLVTLRDWTRAKNSCGRPPLYLSDFYCTSSDTWSFSLLLRRLALRSHTLQFTTIIQVFTTVGTQRRSQWDPKHLETIFPTSCKRPTLAMIRCSVRNRFGQWGMSLYFGYRAGPLWTWHIEVDWEKWAPRFSSQ